MTEDKIHLENILYFASQIQNLSEGNFKRKLDNEAIESLWDSAEGAEQGVKYFVSILNDAYDYEKADEALLSHAKTYRPSQSFYKDSYEDD